MVKKTITFSRGLKGLRVRNLQEISFSCVIIFFVNVIVKCGLPSSING